MDRATLHDPMAVIEAEIERVINAAPRSDFVRIPVEVAAACRTALATLAAQAAELAAMREALREADSSLQTHAIGAAVLRGHAGLVEKLVKQSDAIKDLLARPALGERRT